MTTPFPPADSARPPMSQQAPTTAWQQFSDSGLPLTPTRYHGMWRSPRWRAWRPIVGALVGLVLLVFASIVFSNIGTIIDLTSGRTTREELLEQARNGAVLLTPARFIANNLALASSIPIVWLVARLHAQPRGFVQSVTGHFRWRWFGSCLAMLLPLWIVVVVIDDLVEGTGLDGLAVNGDTVVLIIGILLTTPLQSAGEEWLFRGGVNRLVGSCFPQRTRMLTIISAFIGGAVSSVLFMLVHFAQDPWLNLSYLCFGAVASFVCYRTGGLEASTAMHIINNLTAMAFLPFSDISHLFDRQAGTGSPAELIQIALLFVAAALIIWRARARGLTELSEPEPAPAPPQLPAWWVAQSSAAPQPSAQGFVPGQYSVPDRPVVPGSQSVAGESAPQQAPSPEQGQVFSAPSAGDGLQSWAPPAIDRPSTGEDPAAGQEPPVEGGPGPRQEG